MQSRGTGDGTISTWLYRHARLHIPFLARLVLELSRRDHAVGVASNNGKFPVCYFSAPAVLVHCGPGLAGLRLRGSFSVSTVTLLEAAGLPPRPPPQPLCTLSVNPRLAFVRSTQIPQADRVAAIQRSLNEK